MFSVVISTVQTVNKFLCDSTAIQVWIWMEHQRNSKRTCTYMLQATKNVIIHYCVTFWIQCQFKHCFTRILENLAYYVYFLKALTSVPLTRIRLGVFSSFKWLINADVTYTKYFGHNKVIEAVRDLDTVAGQ